MFYNHKSKLMIAVLLLANLQVNCMATVGKRVLQAYGVGILGSGLYHGIESAKLQLKYLKHNADLDALEYTLSRYGETPEEALKKGMLAPNEIESIYDSKHISRTILATTSSAWLGLGRGTLIGVMAPIMLPVAAVVYCGKFVESQHRSTKIEPTEAVQSKRE